jgi:hypothetical protein
MADAAVILCQSLFFCCVCCTACNEPEKDDNTKEQATKSPLSSMAPRPSSMRTVSLSGDSKEELLDPDPTLREELGPRVV